MHTIGFGEETENSAFVHVKFFALEKHLIFKLVVFNRNLQKKIRDSPATPGCIFQR